MSGSNNFLIQLLGMGLQGVGNHLQSTAAPDYAKLRREIAEAASKDASKQEQGTSLPEAESTSAPYIEEPPNASEAGEHAAESPDGTEPCACGRDHITTASAALKEALRFARRNPDMMSDNEIQRRLDLAREELDIWERIDATPERLQGMPDDEKELEREALVKAGEIRHMMDDTGLAYGVGEVDDLESLALKTEELQGWYRGRLSQIRGAKIAFKLRELRNRMEAGEIDHEGAKAELIAAIAEPTAAIKGEADGQAT